MSKHIVVMILSVVRLGNKTVMMEGGSIYVGGGLVINVIVVTDFLILSDDDDDDGGDDNPLRIQLMKMKWLKPMSPMK